MKRLFWMGIGGAVAVTGARRARRALQPVSTVAGPVTGWLAAIRTTWSEFAAAMSEHEAELKAAFIEAPAPGPAPDPRRKQANSWASAADEDEPEDF
mgnify:CR=1 FL=1